MAGHECWLLTVTRGRDVLGCDLRSGAWHVLLTRMKQQWPEAQAWTCLEYGKRRGVHLHAVVKNTAGLLTQAWLDQWVALQGDGTCVHLVRVYGDSETLPRYLTKSLAQAYAPGSWPRYVRPVSATRGWCPRAA
jgi:hypothetical protein